MRVGREEWGKLHPDDVAWVTEWQLASAFRWVPVGSECPVRAAGGPEPGSGVWRVDVRAGSTWAGVELPVRDLARVIAWCYGAPHVERLLHPPAHILAALRVLRAALRPALRGLDPLARMGYLEGHRASGGPA